MKSILDVCWLATALLCALLATCAIAQEKSPSEVTAPVTDGAQADDRSEDSQPDEADSDAESESTEAGQTAEEGAAEAEQPAADEADDEAGQKGTETSADAEAAKAEFDEKFAEWKAAMKEIDSLRIEYQGADEPTREQLQKQLQEQFEVARAMIPGVVAAAHAAFDAAPNTDKELSDFLNAIAFHHVRSDRYEDALPIVRSLIAGGVKHDYVPVLGGISAFTMGDYETAQELFARSKETGFFDAPPTTRDPVAQQFWQMAKQFSETLDAHRQEWERELEIRAQEAAADDLPRILLETSAGDITLELFENEAPNTVKSFISLVEEDYYNGRSFHRVLENFMAQGGSSDGEGREGPGYCIPCECYQENARHHFRGSLSMAKKQPKDTGGSQFFITFLPTLQLDGKHTVFGRVIEGMDVLAKIQRRNPDPPGPNAPPPNPETLPEPDTITEAKVLRKRPDTDYSDFKKLPER